MGSVQKAQKLTAPIGAGSWRNVSGRFPSRSRFGLTPASTGREAANTGAGKRWRMEPAETSLRPRPAVGSGVDTKLGQSRAPVTLACQGSVHGEVTLIMDATLAVCAVLIVCWPCCLLYSCTMYEDGGGPRPPACLVHLVYRTQKYKARPGPPWVRSMALQPAAARRERGVCG